MSGIGQPALPGAPLLVGTVMAQAAPNTAYAPE